MSKKPGKFEASWNKRAGIFYGPATGHPIQWNKDWNDLIGKEVNVLQKSHGVCQTRSRARWRVRSLALSLSLAGAFARSLARSHMHTPTHQSTARDNFSRKFLAGQIGAPLPVYADVSMNDANWNAMLKSTYEELGQ